MLHDLLIVFKCGFGEESSLLWTEFENKPKIWWMIFITFNFKFIFELILGPWKNHYLINCKNGSCVQQGKVFPHLL